VASEGKHRLSDVIPAQLKKYLLPEIGGGTSRREQVSSAVREGQKKRQLALA
jgi:hypothetical protein